MAPRKMALREAEGRLAEIAEELAHAGPGEPLFVTYRRKPILVLMSHDQYEGLMETLEIMSDPELMADLRESIKQADAGELLSMEEVAQSLGL